MLTTYYSSFAFGIVALIAFSKKHWIGWLFQVLYGTSVLYHAKYNEEYAGKEILHTIDKTTAHLIVGATILLALIQKKPILLCMFIYWCCLTYITYVYYVAKFSFLPGDEWIPWHASIHLAASAGVIALLSHY
jgi:hypothetical protein